MSYRYQIAPDAKVNAFKPKDLMTVECKMSLRSAQFGALWCNKLNQLPKSSHCDVVWEAGSFIQTATSPHFLSAK